MSLDVPEGAGIDAVRGILLVDHGVSMSIRKKTIEKGVNGTKVFERITQTR